MTNELEISLEARFTVFRKIWVQKTKLNSICITLFSNNNYDMLFEYRLPNQLDFELCEKIIMEYLKTIIK